MTYEQYEAKMQALQSDYRYDMLTEEEYRVAVEDLEDEFWWSVESDLEVLREEDC